MPNAMMNDSPAASMNEYRMYSRACVAAGLQPMPKTDWQSYGTPAGPSGREQKMG